MKWKWGFKCNIRPDFKYEGANDVVGIVMLETQTASDLPRLSKYVWYFIHLSLLLIKVLISNSNRLGYESFRRHFVRQEVIPYTHYQTFIQPGLDEKLLSCSSIRNSIPGPTTRYPWLGQTYLERSYWRCQFLCERYGWKCTPAGSSEGLYSVDDDGDHPVTDYKLQLMAAEEVQWAPKYNPVIKFRYASFYFVH